MTFLQLFILFTFISVVAGPVDLANREGICLNDALTKMGWMPVIVLIIIYGLTWWVSGLWGLHLYLAAAGTTTMEHLREKFVDSPNPFDRGFVRNVLRALGAVDPASLTDTYDPFIVKFEREMARMHGKNNSSSS